MFSGDIIEQESAGNFTGAASWQDLFELQKALGTGGALTGGQPAGTGAPLRVESLESTLKTTTYRMEHLKFWRAIPKKRAYNTAEEYNVLDSYGAEASAFFEEGGLPDEEDANYRREVGIVKFLGNTRVVTHPMTLVKAAHGNVIARETINGTMWLLNKLELSLFNGDDTLNPLAFKGLKQQIWDGVGGYGADQIIDLRGNPLSEEYLELGSQTIADYYAQMQLVFMDTRTLSDLAKQFYPKERIQLPAPVNGVAGTPMTHFASQNGLVRLEPDVFLKPKGAPKLVAGKYAPNTPAAPTPNIVVDPNSLHVTANYDYWVTSVGIKGTESAPVYVGGPVAAVAGSIVTLSITQVSAGAYAKNPRAYSYNVYRAPAAATPNPAKAGFIGAVADPRNALPGSAAAAVFTDYNRILPFTSTAFGLYLDGEQGMSFKQLAPLMKVDLATIAASIRWMILLYGMLQVYAPTKQILFINIGRLER
jgi:hypothetical protein